MDAPSCCLVSHTLDQGVGPADANRLLAAELTRQGYHVSLCAIADPSAEATTSDSMEIAGSQAVTLRIPRSAGWDVRVPAIERFLAEQRPDAVILRFIPYMLDPKGIVWEAARHLPTVLRGQKVIWLMDEIWLGEDSFDLKRNLVGIVQRFCMLRLLRGVRPHRIYTNNRLNTRVLRRCGMQAETLRLFGNIPIAQDEGGAWLCRELAQAEVPITLEARAEWLVLGNFGVFHPEWQPAAFLAKLAERGRRHGRRICIAGIGALGACQAHWEAVAAAWSGEISFVHLGRRSEVEVSHFLQSVDLGLTSNPYCLVGKSGTCMAMLDHGLPIIVPRIAAKDDRTEFPENMVLRTGDDPGDGIFAPRRRHMADPQLPRAAAQLVAAMKEAR